MTTVAFIVTGFSSFHGVDENPTEQLVKWLQLKLSDSGFQHMHQEIKVRDIRVLRVAAENVDAYFIQLAQELKGVPIASQGLLNGSGGTGLIEGSAASPTSPSAATKAAAAKQPQPEQQPRQRLVLLHLGVASTATVYQLESRAYNCADFRIPDVAGWHPVKEEIEAGRGLGMWVGSRLPLAGICERLAACGHSVVVSEDAGRFICNWTYYRACRLAERFGMEAVFVHVPPFAVFGEDKQRAFLLDAMQVIADVVHSSQPAKTDCIAVA